MVANPVSLRETASEWLNLDEAMDMYVRMQYRSQLLSPFLKLLPNMLLRIDQELGASPWVRLCK